MAWERVKYPLNFQGELINQSLIGNTGGVGNRQSDAQNRTWANNYLTGTMILTSTFSQTETTIYEKGEYTLTAQYLPTGHGVMLRFYSPNLSTVSLQFGSNGTYNNEFKMDMWVNHETQRASLVGCVLTINNYFCWIKEELYNDQLKQLMYNWITNSAPVYHTYKSVTKFTSDTGNTMLSKTGETDGEPVYLQPAAEGFYLNDNMNLALIMSSMSVNEERTIGMLGHKGWYHWVTLTKLEYGWSEFTETYIFNFILKFYMEGSSQSDLEITYYYGVLSPDSWFTFLVDHENAAARPSVIRGHAADNSTYDWNLELDGATDQILNRYYQWLAVGWSEDDAPQNPYEDNGTNKPAGGVDYEPRDNDVIVDSSHPTSDVTNCGFIKVYSLNAIQMASLAGEVWDDNFIQSIKKLFNNPVDAIIGINYIPIVPERSGTLANIKVGNVSMNTQAYPVTSQWKDIPLGEVTVKAVWDAYLDSSPYTSVSIFLPFIGVRKLECDDVMQTFFTATSADGRNGDFGKRQAKVKVDYTFDIITGACIAKVKVNDSLHYEFGGSAAASVPFTSGGYQSAFVSSVSVAANIASILATGGLSAPVAGPALAGSVAGMKTDIEKTGNLSGNSAMMSSRRPYLIFEYPEQARPENQERYTGLPSYMEYSISELSGFTQFYDIHIEGFACTDEERSELEDILKKGVII